tara:strand:+ start:53157 stop:54029 length:873 start_codon:yes stop_codon:yes gene_type:complete
MPEINKHNLSRYIPQEVQREVRQNSFFGCVICGGGICAIDHVDPEFNDAKSHSADCMTLLCGSCHDKKTRGIIGIETVKKAMAEPYCSKNKMPSDFLDFGNGVPRVQFGKILFINPSSVISIDGVSILSIKPPNHENLHGRHLLNAFFHDISGEEIFKIEDNIWHGSIKNWDIQSIGKTITIRSKKGSILLEIENIPEDKLIIHKLIMVFKKYQVEIDKNGVEIITPTGKELFSLNGKKGKVGEIEGEIALNIKNERILVTDLNISDVDLKVKGGDVSYNVIRDSDITLG